MFEILGHRQGLGGGEAASQWWASSDLLTLRIWSKWCLGTTPTAVASTGRVATAFQGLLLKAFPSRMRVATFLSMVMMVYLAFAATRISRSCTDARVGHFTFRGSSTFMMAGLLSLQASLLITTVLFSRQSSSDVDVDDNIRWKGQDWTDELEPELPDSDDNVLWR